MQDALWTQACPSPRTLPYVTIRHILVTRRPTTCPPHDSVINITLDDFLYLFIEKWGRLSHAKHGASLLYAIAEDGSWLDNAWNTLLKTRIVHVVDSATAWTSQRIPYHVNVLFNNVMIIYRSSKHKSIASTTVATAIGDVATLGWYFNQYVLNWDLLLC